MSTTTVYEATRARDSAHVVLSVTLRAQFEAEDRDDVGVHVQVDVTRAQAALVEAERVLYHARLVAQQAAVTTRGLGDRQVSVLELLGGRRSLRSRRSPAGETFYPGDGWTFSSDLETVKILDSLVRRGLVSKDEHDVYRITDTGRQVLVERSPLPSPRA